MAQVLRGEVIERLIDYCVRFFSNQFINCLPSKSLYKRSARGIKFAASHNSSGSVLELLKVIFRRETAGSPNRAAVSDVGLHNTRVEGF